MLTIRSREFTTYGLKTTTPWRDETAEFEGVLQKDVLAATGLDTTDAIALTAENDYRAVISRDTRQSVSILTATRVDGQPHSRRARALIISVIDVDEFAYLDAKIRSQHRAGGCADSAQGLRCAVRPNNKSRPSFSWILDTLASRIGCLAVVGSLVCVCAGTGYFKPSFVSQLEQSHAVFRDGQSRNGYVPMSDIQRLKLVTQRGADVGRMTDEVESGFVDAADILCLCTDSFQSVM